ncbi:carboxymuconolactone decarboxylase family protein [Marinithermus hydrothermalis]|uniref:Carboxymuconolactone decarboxylase n=1 Tax=Marinithermus hydrothermalis (strain DSM 14884 / JCM 11576 / T1) TaxID=869210 RepID=F2NQZ6_MARHT|nr:carboxymuconolactone decarboxylase family protein [Marinithermus hydrothermalis]AEB12574.1 Carboxymuconolactone decarboxylase [Marinithermus hydrothermalis DSM 14884]
MSFPEAYQNLRARYPDLAAAYDALGDAAHQAGPLPERERRLVKLALAIGAGLEGAVHSHTRKALEAGLTPDELRHAALLAVTTLGLPAAVRALSWVEDELP